MKIGYSIFMAPVGYLAHEEGSGKNYCRYSCSPLPEAQGASGGAWLLGSRVDSARGALDAAAGKTTPPAAREIPSHRV